MRQDILLEGGTVLWVGLRETLHVINMSGLRMHSCPEYQKLFLYSPPPGTSLSNNLNCESCYAVPYDVMF